MDAQTLDALAKGLSEAQRMAVWRGYAMSIITARGLAKHGLLSSYARMTGENFVRLHWSDAGLALRDHLLAKGEGPAHG